jgi:hypothetical protein
LGRMTTGAGWAKYTKINNGRTKNSSIWKRVSCPTTSINKTIDR